MTKRIVALLGAAVIVLAACSPAASNPPATQGPGQTGGPQPTQQGGGLDPDQILRAYIASTDPETLTPYHAQDAVSNAVLVNVHRGLLYYDKDLNTVPAAAEALPEASADGKTLTFKIRSDAVYADGSKIVGADFVRAFRQLVDPRVANPYNYIVCPVAGVAEVLGSSFGCGSNPSPDATDNALIDGLLDKVGVTAPDESTVVFNLAQPATYFAAITAMWLLVPVKAEWIGPDGLFTEDAIIGQGSGPFVVDSWEHNSRITLKPNPNWYGETKPTLTEVDYEIGGPIEEAFTAYERGDLDIVLVTNTALIHQIDDDAALSAEAHDTATLGLTYYDFANCADPSATAANPKCPASTATKDGKAPTANKEFRIALSQAINKQEFIDVTFGGLGLPADSVVMPGIPGYDPDYHPYPFDVDAANTHMATALTEMGIADNNADGEVSAADAGTLSFGYNCDAGHLPRVTYLAEHWRTALGFTETQFDISCTDFPTLLKERPNGKYMISRDGWNADFPHPVNQLSDLFRCGGGNNNGQSCNPEFDALLDQAAVEPDQNKAIALYVEAQRKLIDGAPAMFLRWGTTRWMVKPYVQDIIITSSDHENPGDYFLETIKLADH
jgi:ABC-type transport system substrate-binding protein